MTAHALVVVDVQRGLVSGEHAVPATERVLGDAVEIVATAAEVPFAQP